MTHACLLSPSSGKRSCFARRVPARCDLWGWERIGEDELSAIQAQIRRNLAALFITEDWDDVR